MEDFSYIVKRKTSIFKNDIVDKAAFINDIINNSRFLVIGAAGSIGRAVTGELFKRNPKALHAVDISENNLAELVRDLRSGHGYISGEFKHFALIVGLTTLINCIIKR